MKRKSGKTGLCLCLLAFFVLLWGEYRPLSLTDFDDADGHIVAACGVLFGGGENARCHGLGGGRLRYRLRYLLDEPGGVLAVLTDTVREHDHVVAGGAFEADPLGVKLGERAYRRRARADAEERLTSLDIRRGGTALVEGCLARYEVERK